MIVAALAFVLTATAPLQVAQAPAAGPVDPDSTRLVASLGVRPETVTVGQPFRSYVSVRSQGAGTIAFAEIPTTDTLQMVDTLRALAAEGSMAAAYTLTAWVAGTPLLQTALVEIVLRTGERRSYRVPLRLPIVQSVLPTEGDVLPKPPKGMLLPAVNQFPWWLLALVAAAVLGGLIIWWLRRPRKVVILDPREEALASLAEIEREVGAPVDRRYASVSRVLRRYLGRVEPAWGEDLTTSELLRRIDRDDFDRRALATLLQQADLVKFAALARTEEEAAAFLVAAREWIAGNPSEPAVQREAA